MKYAIVTGSSGGIGQAIVSLFLEKGWFVFGIDIKPTNLTDKNFYFINSGISKISEIKKIYEGISNKTDKIHTLVNNAAIQISKPFLEISEEDWNKTFDVNIKAAFFLSQQFYTLLKNAKGNIINISSVHALATSKNISPYAISKAAISGLTRSLAVELAKDNIRVNAVLPAAIDTPMLRSGLNRGHLNAENEEEMLKELGNRHLLGRIGKPEEVAKAVWFLADDEQSSFITGISLLVDGGVMAKLNTE